MATFSELKTSVLRMIGEDVSEEAPPLAGSVTSAIDLQAAVHAALLALSSRYWKPAVLEVAASPTEVVAVVPADLLAVEAVYDLLLTTFIPKTFFQVGNSISGSNQNSWTDYPQGEIVFSSPLTAGGIIYYSAHWTLPSDDSDVIEAPNMCLTYLQLFAASYCLLRKASEQAEIRQYASKVDAGTPVMLPAKDLSDFFLKRSEIEKQNLPMRQKGIS